MFQTDASVWRMPCAKFVTLMARSSFDVPMKDRLLTAAMEVFASKGYHGTAVDDIVAVSKSSKGAFYHYFPSKQGVFLTLMDDLASMVEQGVETAIDTEHGALAKVEAALRVVIETAAAQKDLARILLIEAVGLGPELEAKRLEIHRRFASMIQRHLDHAVTEKSIPPQNTEILSRAWLGALNEIVTQWLVHGEGSLTGQLPALRAILLRSIGAEPKAHGD